MLAGVRLYERLCLQVPYPRVTTASIEEVSVSAGLLNHGIIHIPAMQSVSPSITRMGASPGNVQDEICVPR